MNKLQKYEVESMEMDMIGFRQRGLHDMDEKKRMLEQIENFKLRLLEDIESE